MLDSKNFGAARHFSILSSINEILTKNFLPDDSSDIVGGPRVFYQVGGPRSLGGPNLVGGGAPTPLHTMHLVVPLSLFMFILLALY